MPERDKTLVSREMNEDTEQIDSLPQCRQLNERMLNVEESNTKIAEINIVHKWSELGSFR